MTVRGTGRREDGKETTKVRPGKWAEPTDDGRHTKGPSQSSQTQLPTLPYPTIPAGQTTLRWEVEVMRPMDSSAS